MKLSNSLLLSLIGLAILSVLGWRGTDVSGSIVALVASYIGTRGAQKVGMVYSASIDKDCNTTEIIDKLK